MDKIANVIFWEVDKSDIHKCNELFAYIIIVIFNVLCWLSMIIRGAVVYALYLIVFPSDWIIINCNIKSCIVCRMADDRPGCVGLVGSSEPIFSGLYSYHVPTNTWKKLCDDVDGPSTPGVAGLISRVGHTMLFHPVSLFILFFYIFESTHYISIV
jgi:hypothetical protein